MQKDILCIDESVYSTVVECPAIVRVLKFSSTSEILEISGVPMSRVGITDDEEVTGYKLVTSTIVDNVKPSTGSMGTSKIQKELFFKIKLD